MYDILYVSFCTSFLHPARLTSELNFFFMKEMFCVLCAWEPFYGRTFRDWSQFCWSNFEKVLCHRSQNICPWLIFPLSADCILDGRKDGHLVGFGNWSYLFLPWHYVNTLHIIVTASYWVEITYSPESPGSNTNGTRFSVLSRQVPKPIQPPVQLVLDLCQR